jgi:hypothetical protein
MKNTHALKKERPILDEHVLPKVSYEEPIIDRTVERRLVRKLDMRILPVLWILYLANFVDRANVSASIYLFSI